MPTSIPLSDGSGELLRYADFASQFVASRHVDVWLPPGYDTADPATRYPVLYLHDGQNLFDPAVANTGIDWGVDEAVVRLMSRQNVPGAVVVAIWNSPQRVLDYMPAAPLTAAPDHPISQRFVANCGALPLADGYLRLLVEEIKPLIDATYRTLPDAPHTFVMGSSMGGLISLYALCQYPHIFGGAGCLSTHWPIGEEMLVDYFGAAVPRAGSHKLYFDYGSVNLDALYPPYQERMDGHVRKAGYKHGRDWLTHSFPGADHNEAAWRARLDVPLAFLWEAV
ncbi:MAG: alpha/beta hydrolase-fold protein [Chloroflexi bacterium]|nr:alpha/beta hydrolase-fold protein [Chloroflexota bacterium]